MYITGRVALLATLSCLSTVISTASAQQPPQGHYAAQPDYGAKPDYSARPKHMTETDSNNKSSGSDKPSSVKMNGAIGGKVSEKDGYVIVDGATIVGDGADTNLLKTTTSGKRIILNNVSVVSNNATATLVDLTSGKDNDIHIRNMRIRSNNSNIYDDKCAANICLDGNASNGDNDNTEISVTVSGVNRFTAGN